MITLVQANLVIDAALARARELALPPVGVAVLDPGGHLKAVQIEDGLNFLRVRVCQAKAWGALGLGVDSSKIAARYESGGPNPGFIDSLNAMSGGNVVPLAGGLLLRDPDGSIVGAIGVSGAAPEEDEVSAAAGKQAFESGYLPS